MHLIKRLSRGLGLATIAYLPQISLAAAHAGEHHPPLASDVPWPFAGPIIALLISGAAFWLANRDSQLPSVSRVADPIDQIDADPNQPGARSNSSGGLAATGHTPRKRTDLVALRSRKAPSPRSAKPPPSRFGPRTLEETWMTNDSTR